MECSLGFSVSFMQVFSCFLNCPESQYINICPIYLMRKEWVWQQFAWSKSWNKTSNYFAYFAMQSRAYKIDTIKVIIYLKHVQHEHSTLGAGSEQSTDNKIKLRSQTDWGIIPVTSFLSRVNSPRVSENFRSSGISPFSILSFRWTCSRNGSESIQLGKSPFSLLWSKWRCSI